MRTLQADESALLLLDAVEVLDQAGVAYAVVGAMAAAVHGVVRASMDADAVVLLPAHRAGELERQFHAAAFMTELRHGEPGDPIAAVLALSDRFGNRVDRLFGLRGLGAGAFSRAIVAPFQERELRIIGREDFIAMKLFAHGPQDLLDAGHALAAASQSLDLRLLRDLTAPVTVQRQRRRWSACWRAERRTSPPRPAPADRSADARSAPCRSRKHGAGVTTPAPVQQSGRVGGHPRHPQKTQKRRSA